nr:hypothetical protein [uncultured Ottowia sp.]
MNLEPVHGLSVGANRFWQPQLGLRCHPAPALAAALFLFSSTFPRFKCRKN